MQIARITFVSTVAVMLGIASPSRADRAEFLVARDGQAEASIVIAPSASPQVKAVAEELAAQLSRICGGEFQVASSIEATGIVVGTCDDFPDVLDGQDKEALEIHDAYDGREAYIIRTDSSCLRLIGATELGTSHAVYRFLEEIGCRWFFPAPAWKVVPSRSTIRVSLNIADRPAILSRRIWWGYGCFDAQARSDYDAWARHNRMAMSRSIYCGHAWQNVIGSNAEAFESHPEYLALVDGKRRGPQFCVSNPAVRELAIQWALDYLGKHPEEDMVSLETSDGSNHCECDACAQLGSISDRVFGLANEAAREVARKYPGKMVGMYAYNDHCEPPSFPLEDNVYVQSTAGFIHGRYTFDELMQLWPKVTHNIGFYEYFSVWLWDFDRLPGGRAANVADVTERIRRYAQLGASSLDCESGNNWGVHGRGYYIANRLMWNPAADVDALLTDFYEQAFGPAARIMRRYYERLDPVGKPLVSELLIAEALRDLQEASRLAAGRPDVLTRLTQLKQYLHYVRLRWDYDRSSDKAVKEEAALAAITHVYRTRYSYMNHWEAIRQSWTVAAAKDFNQPSWSFREKDNPWRVDRPLTEVETECHFQTDLERFPLQTIAQRQFSGPLVPAGLNAERPVRSYQQFQHGCRYALYSRAGEVLEVSVKTGIIAWYRDRADARYTLAAADGKTISSGRLPQDGEKHSLRFEVPAAGLYWFEFDDQGAAWGLEVAPERLVTLDLRDASKHHLGHMQRMYFFVPRGTQRVEYFWQGGPHEVCGPDGQVVAEVKDSGKFVSVEVPDGMDAKAWSLTHLALGQLRFMNVPNYLAASPAALLVPEAALEEPNGNP